MRRGLMAWSAEELPAAELQARVGAVAAGARAAGLNGILVNTNFARPADVAWLTGFTPYWNQGVLLVTPDAAAVLVCALSQRVADWIRSVSRMDDVVCTQDIGAGLAKRLPAEGAVRLGVVDLANFPAAPLARLRAALPGIALEDASGLLAQARREVADSPAIGARLEEIARIGLRAGIAAAADGDANAMIAAAERACRLEGAEEVLVNVAPDLATDGRLRRIEGPCALGERYALQLAVAYKGLWCRVARSTTRGATRDGTADIWTAKADAWFDRLPPLTCFPGRVLATELAALDGPGPGQPTLDAWRIEGDAHGLPIGVLAGSAPFEDAQSLPDGRLNLFVRLKAADGYWLAAWPLSRP